MNAQRYAWTRRLGNDSWSTLDTIWPGYDGNAYSTGDTNLFALVLGHEDRVHFIYYKTHTDSADRFIHSVSLESDNTLGTDVYVERYGGMTQPYSEHRPNPITITANNDGSGDINETQTVHFSDGGFVEEAITPDVVTNSWRVDYPPENTLDGNTGTRFVSTGETLSIIYLQYDFGETVELAKLRLWQGVADRWVDTIDIYGSADGVHFSFIQQYTGLVIGWQEFVLDNVEAYRYWRLYERQAEVLYWQVGVVEFYNTTYETVTSGTFRLDYDSNPTSDLDWNISLANLETAVEGLAGITAATVTGTVSEYYKIEITDPANTDMVLLVVDDNSLSPATTIEVVEFTKGLTADTTTTYVYWLIGFNSGSNSNRDSIEIIFESHENPVMTYHVNPDTGGGDDGFAYGENWGQIGFLIASDDGYASLVRQERNRWYTPDGEYLVDGWGGQIYTQMVKGEDFDYRRQYVGGNIPLAMDSSHNYGRIAYQAPSTQWEMDWPVLINMGQGGLVKLGGVEYVYISNFNVEYSNLYRRGTSFIVYPLKEIPVITEEHTSDAYMRWVLDQWSTSDAVLFVEGEAPTVDYKSDASVADRVTVYQTSDTALVDRGVILSTSDAFLVAEIILDVTIDTEFTVDPSVDLLEVPPLGGKLVDRTTYLPNRSIRRNR